MAEMAEVAARKYGRLIEAMDSLYANSTGAQKEWIDNNWKSILDGMPANNHTPCPSPTEAS